MQARAQDSQANDLASGTSTRESFANWHPDSLSWKTSQRSLLVGWTPYSEPWPRSGTTLSGRAYERPTWVQGIDGNGCLSSPGRRMVDTWATPSASDGLAENLSPGMGARERGPQNLMECVAKDTWPNWPTASATDYKGSSKPGQRRGQLSEAMVRTWPTTDASVANDGEDLTSWLARRERVTWPTPSKSDPDGSRTLPEGTSPTGVRPDGKKAQVGLPNAAGHAPGAKLNPAWVEQLMGFPSGWTLLDPAKPKPSGKRPASSRKRRTEPTASEPSATPSSRKSRSSSGEG